MYVAPVGVSQINNSVSVKNSNKTKTANVLCRDFCVNYSTSPLLDYKAYNSKLISFEGRDQHLISKFFKSDGTKKIYQFLCESKHTTPVQVRKFLDKILSDEELSRQFIQEITQDPRKSASTVVTLTKKLGGDAGFRDWYFADNGYINAFGRYVGNHLYYKSETESKMLEYMPNWILSKVWEKAQFYGHDPIIGDLPSGFGSHNDFIRIVNRLKHLKAGEKCSFHSNGEYDLEKLFDKEKSTSKVTHKGNGKSYIIKVDHLNLDPFYDRIRPNSVYLESAIGHYATSHNCKNAAKFYYYDGFHNAGLFENIEGTIPQYINILERNKTTSDLMSLGIFCNDIDVGNYRLTSEGLKVIDFGHASYFDGLKPGDMGNTMDLPNFARPNFLLTYNTSNIADFVSKNQGQ